MNLRAVVLGALVCAVSAHAGQAQSLAPVAREEALRRRAVSSPAQVLRNVDLVSTGRLTVVGVPPAAGPDTNAQPADARLPLTPALYETGALPTIPVQAVSGGEVILEVSVGDQGSVDGVRVLRDTPPFTAAAVAAVEGWLFRPAEDVAAPEAGEPINLQTRRASGSKVLVVGLFRPPALFPITLGQPPVDLGVPSEQVPTPTAWPVLPQPPPQALFDGIALAEVRVGEEGVPSVRIVRSAPGLDASTLDALGGLRFRPARVHGLPTATMVYVVAAFPQPITP